MEVKVEVGEIAETALWSYERAYEVDAYFPVDTGKLVTCSSWCQLGNDTIAMNPSYAGSTSRPPLSKH